MAAVKPGVKGSDIHRQVCDFFHEHGHKTQLHKAEGEALVDGYFHATGHGVGLEVHERPGLGRVESEPLVAGDVIALEPGLYRKGYGGVRLEDLILVTDGRRRGADRLPLRPRAVSEQTIETIFVEDRRYPPPPDFAALAVAQPDIYERDFDEFWESEGRERVTLVRAVHERSTSGSSPTRSGTSAASSTSPTTASTATSRRGSATGSPTTGRASPRASGGRSPTPTSRPRSSASRTRSRSSASARGRRSRSTWAWSRSSPSRCSPARASARRTRSSSAASPPTRSPTARTTWAAPSSSPRTRPGVAARPSRSSAPPTRRWPTRRGSSAASSSGARATRCRCSDGRDHWLHELEVSDDPETCPPEPMDSEDLLFLMYTSGTTAKPKGIAHTTGGYLVGVASTHALIFDLKPDEDVWWCAADIGWITGHSYIVYGPLCNATTSRALRGHARLPGQGPLVGDRRALRRHHPLHGADGDPRAHEVGDRARGEARPLLAAAARDGRRADQPGGVGLVPRAHRRRPDARRRHVVADRDRDGADHAAARRDDAEARLGDEAVPGRRGRGLQRGRRGGRPGRRRLPRPEAALAGDDARHLRRRRALPRRPTGSAIRASTSPATARGSTRTATSGCSAGSTT